MSGLRRRGRRGPWVFADLPLALVLALTLAACDQPQMAEQPRLDVYEPARHWPDNQSARHPPAGTVARDAVLAPRPARIPLPVDAALLTAGRHGFNTFCAPCHGRSGYGDGMIVRHGFPAPPSFHSPRLRSARLAHFYDVITEGYGVMYSYAARVPRDARWAIAAYIRALQVSQHTPLRRLNPALRERLDQKAGSPAAAVGSNPHLERGAGRAVSAAAGAGAPQ